MSLSTWPFCPTCNASPDELCTGLTGRAMHPERRQLLLAPHDSRPLRRSRTAHAIGMGLGWVIVLAGSAVALTAIFAGAWAAIRWLLP